jgi:hypothetical protein
MQEESLPPIKHDLARDSHIFGIIQGVLNLGMGKEY